MDSIYDRDIDDQKAFNELRKLVRPIPVVKKTSGNYDRDANRIVLGCLAGPSMEVDNALHELGHLLISSDENCNRPNWGLCYKKWVDCPVSRMGGYYDVSTCQDVKLEAKVWTVQYVIRQKIGYIGESISELVKSADFLQGFCYIPVVESEEKDYSKKRFNTIIKWIEDMLEQREYKLDYLLKELKRKKSLITRKINEGVTS